MITWGVRIWVAHRAAGGLSSRFRVCSWIVLGGIWRRIQARIALRVVLRYLTLGLLR